MEFIEFNDYVKCKYDNVGYFSEGLASVRNSDGRYGYINKEGKEVIPCNYLGVGVFHDGFAVVQNE